MIAFTTVNHEGKSYRAIIFDEEGIKKEIWFRERGLNTLSPMDPELLKVLDDMKEVK